MTTMVEKDYKKINSQNYYNAILITLHKHGLLINL